MSTKPRVLIVDDEPDVVDNWSRLLGREDYACITATDGERALSLLESERPEIVLTDLKMPRADGMQVLARALEVDPDAVVIMITGHGTVESAVEAMRAGAFDYLLKPLPSNDVLRLAVGRAAERRRLVEENRRLREPLAPRAGFDHIVGQSTAMGAVFVYHCATPMVANHITSGMYGLILVEPPGGLPKVDREFYVMQGELYTDRPFGQRGHDEFSVDKLLAERAEYFVFNGAVGALTAEYPMKAKVGETVRIFFGVGGPNATSSFHVIGEIFDRVYDQAAIGSPGAANVQTTTVPAGGATIVEFKLEVPGRYILVDHALSRLERGLAGFLVVDGPANPDVFHGEGAASMVGH
jgi:CheY-like chemotaxis protein